MSPTKKQKLSNDNSDEEVSSDEHLSIDEAEDSELPSGSEDSGSEPDTEDEIAKAKNTKSKQTLKRKRRATEPSRFGATLQHLLNTEAPSTLPLSLKPEVARKRNDEKLESKAKKALRFEKKEKEDQGRIKDVIGGWGGESERALRKVAQRGVVKLFNAIQKSQIAAGESAEAAKASRGSGKPTLPAPSTNSSNKSKGKHKDNIIGRGKETTVDKDDFFSMIRSGGVVSKA